MDYFIKLIPNEGIRAEIKLQWSKKETGLEKWEIYRNTVERFASE
jgi:hypothetical protein